MNQEKQVVQSESQPTWKKQHGKAYWREYHRERYRRINNIPPEKFVKTKEEMKEEIVKKYGDGAYEYYKDMLELSRKRYVKKTKVECPVCKCLVTDTEGRWKQHYNTINHKTAKETLEKHGISV